jgi:hypothetical protein
MTARIRMHVDCSVEGCDRDTERRGMCNRHYLRWKRNGTTTIPCSVEGCANDHAAQGYCNMHYKRLQRHGDVGSVEKTERTFQDGCDVEGCTKPHDSRGLCQAHYFRLRRTGSPLGVGPLPLSEVVKLRRLVGIPIDGPTPEMRAQYARDEARS